MARNDTCIFALSVNPDELKRKLIKSLYENYTREQIKERNFIVVCQGFDEEVLRDLETNYPEINFWSHPRVSGPISYIRDEITKDYGILDPTRYKYVVLIDDDFKYGDKAFEQYDYYLDVMDYNPDIGFVAMHRRIKPEARKEISPLELPYPHDLGAISMRNGLLVRTEAIPYSGLFNPQVVYHEEMFMALKVYLNGYKIAKGWMDIFHQSNKAGLGCKLQKEHNITQNNDIMSSKKAAYDLGYFDIEPGHYFYEGQDSGCLSRKAHDEHTANYKARFGG